MTRKRCKRSDRDDLLRYLDHAREWLRPTCGALVVGRRRNTHAGCAAWLESAESALALVEDLRYRIARSQGWPEAP